MLEGQGGEPRVGPGGRGRRTGSFAVKGEERVAGREVSWKALLWPEKWEKWWHCP